MNSLRPFHVRVGGVLLGLLGAAALGGCASGDEPAPREEEAINLGANKTIGSVEAENVLLVTRAEGEPARIIGLLLNTSDEQVHVTISDDDDSTELTLDPQEQYSFHEHATVLDTADARPGSLTGITVDTGDEQTAFSVPVRDGRLGWLQPYVPN